MVKRKGIYEIPFNHSIKKKTAKKKYHVFEISPKKFIS